VTAAVLMVVVLGVLFLGGSASGVGGAAVVVCDVGI
jgi:hypothetical protein